MTNTEIQAFLDTILCEEAQSVVDDSEPEQTMSFIVKRS